MGWLRIGKVEGLNVVMNLWVPKNAWWFLNGYTTGGLSSIVKLHKLIQ
jgi:hypothetical protein